ncbi:hypothetical protein C5167_030568 [Papaver somniferum]|nr:hypothetical protein C5167_030568 [Papaver somniferum]
MKLKDGYMISSGQPVNEYIGSAVRHVLLRQGLLCSPWKVVPKVAMYNTLLLLRIYQYFPYGLFGCSQYPPDGKNGPLTHYPKLGISLARLQCY